jgi:hypothetical protein
MPFNPAFPRSFTASTVRQFVPAISGVYGISNAGAWIYIGETDNLQASLLAHLQRPNSVMEHQPTGFIFEICDPANRPSRHSRLVTEYRPAFDAYEAGNSYPVAARVRF